MAKKETNEVKEVLEPQEANVMAILPEVSDEVEDAQSVDNSAVGKIFDSKEDETKPSVDFEPIISEPIKAEPIQLERPRKVYAKPNKRSKSVMTSVPMAFPGERIGDFVKVEGKFRQIGQSYGWIYKPNVY